LQPRKFIVALTQLIRPIGILVYLIKHQYLAPTFVKLVGKGENPSFGKVKVVEIHIKTIPRIPKFLTNEVEEEGSFPDSAKPFDANYPGTPVYLMVKFPDDSYITGPNQKFMCFEKIFHLYIE